MSTTIIHYGATTMSTTTIHYGATGCKMKARENVLRNPQRNRVRISLKRLKTRNISAAVSCITGTGTGRLEAGNTDDKNGNGREESEVSSTTKYLDGQLSQLLYSNSDSPVRQVRQIVLVTDGTNNRAYRLSWPSPSVIFDVSPGHVQNVTPRKMTASGLKLPKSCLVQHVPEDFSVVDNDDEDWGEKLLRVGYSGEKPSVWVLEVWNSFSEGHLQKILPVASSLVMKDSVFIGVVPVLTSEVETVALMRKLFADNGFLIEFVAHEKADLHLTLDGSAKYSSSNTSNDHQPPLLTFFTRQLRLSDAQVKYARMQIMMAEEEGDEEGFVDAW